MHKRSATNGATPSSSNNSKLFAFDLLACGEFDTVLEVPGDDLVVLPAPVVGLEPLPGQHGLWLTEQGFHAALASCHLELTQMKDIN